MSVDLVGSTAFKSKHADRREENEPYPVWLNRTKNFYRQFPQALDKHYREFLNIIDPSIEFADKTPKIWKTVGDEIIFCIRLTCIEHLSCCMRAFVRALSSYGDSINRQEKELDVKGCAWIASFPAPNATILSPSGASAEGQQNKVGTQLSEADERAADFNPRDYDFLGKQIDTGFRISKFAQSHELALSLDLAWLLTLLKNRELVDFNFSYKGRESLKGVIEGAPYPIITIQTERSVHRRELEALERSVTGAAFAEPFRLHQYLSKFMEVNDIERPVLQDYGGEMQPEELPNCYKDLKIAWNAADQEEKNRERLIEEAEKYEETDSDGDDHDAGAANAEDINFLMSRIPQD